MRPAFLIVNVIALLSLTRLSFAQTTNATPAPAAPDSPKPAVKQAAPKPAHPTTMSQMQATIDKLTQSNRDLLDLLKQQQAVLQDIQFDRRQQSRHIQSLEERLEQALLDNGKLQAKVSSLAADAAIRPTVSFQPSPSASTIEATNTPSPKSTPPPVVDTPPPPPASYLPPAGSEGPPGTKSWHRLFTLKGTDERQSELFHIQGRSWRVLWHNQDPSDKSLKGTSGLFIDAFPKDDTIPQRVCAKVGTGGDMTDLEGPGNYYLKIKASGGSWELAVEDFR